MSTSGVLDCKVVRGKVDADVSYDFIRTSLLPKLMPLTPIVLSYWTIVQFIRWKKLLLPLIMLEHLYCTFHLSYAN